MTPLLRQSEVERTVALPLSALTKEQLRDVLAEYESSRRLCEEQDYWHSWDGPIEDLRAELAGRR